MMFNAQAMAALSSNPSPIDSSATKPESILKAEALEEFKSLSKQERKLRLKDAKSIYKQYKADKKGKKSTIIDYLDQEKHIGFHLKELIIKTL